MQQAGHDGAAGGRRSSNLRTGLLLASIALAFFIGVMLKYVLFQ